MYGRNHTDVFIELYMQLFVCLFVYIYVYIFIYLFVCVCARVNTLTFRKSFIYNTIHSLLIIKHYITSFLYK